MDDKEVLLEAFRFHGHKCWASTAGVRAGLAALRVLGVPRTGSSDELHCLVEIGDNHGAQCFADGVQHATGCTLGKGNIEKTGWGKLALTLLDKKRERSVRVSYKGTRQQQIAASAFMRKRGQGIPPTEIPDEEAWEMEGSGASPRVFAFLSRDLHRQDTDVRGRRLGIFSSGVFDMRVWRGWRRDVPVLLPFDKPCRFREESLP